MEENIVENKEENKLASLNVRRNNSAQIAGAIIIAGVLIAGAILLKDGSVPDSSKPISKLVGLNVNKFNTCLASGKFKEKIEGMINDGVNAGVTGTPSSFIVKNGKVIDKIEGAQSLDTVMEKINNAKKEDRNPMSVPINPVTLDDHIIGDINAKIIIVEYSDFECPFCKVFHKTMHEVIKNSGGEVAWVYRHFPIPGLHPKAFHEAEATECAWEQKGNDGFWKYADKIFDITPSNNGLLESQL